jgi:hypothetical protein
MQKKKRVTSGTAKRAAEEAHLRASIKALLRRYKGAIKALLRRY